MKIVAEVTNEADQTKRTIVALFPDFIAFEKEFDRAITKLGEGHVLSDLAWLCWHSEHRQKKTAATFEEWCNDIGALNVDDGDNAVNP